MSIRRFNFTGRKRLSRSDIEIKIRGDTQPLSCEIAKLSLEHHNLDEDAFVFIEAYRQSTWMRFPFGTVGEHCAPSTRILCEFDSPEAIRFRVKVVSAEEPRGLLLAAVDKIRPETGAEGVESLLPVKPDSNLGEEVFRLDFEDYPLLLINATILKQWQEVVSDPSFASLVYPAALREILTRILLIEEHTDFEDDHDWRSQWLRFAKERPGVTEDIPLKEDGDSNYSRVSEWIDEIVAAFCKEKRFHDQFTRSWKE